MKKNLLFSLLLVVPFVVKAAPVIKYSYDEIVSDIFWNQLYPEGGWSLYCGLKFSKPRITDDNKALTIDHIYTTSRMIRALHCSSRSDCYKNNKKFAGMEADMHNLYPVWLDLSNNFYDAEFGEIPGENWRVDGCDFERKNGVVEPRVLARGNIARAIFYMHARYDLPVEKKTLQMLKQWNRDDPPSSQEIERNNRIEQIQGNRNAYIDDPQIANKLVAD